MCFAVLHKLSHSCTFALWCVRIFPNTYAFSIVMNLNLVKYVRIYVATYNSYGIVVWVSYIVINRDNKCHNKK